MTRRRRQAGRWQQYVPLADRRRNAAQRASRLEQEGRPLAPVRIAAGGNALARTFWGSSWCRNLERFSDFANRLPRGRTYARNGSVIDLRIEPGKVAALVSGSEIYEVEVAVTPLPQARWQQLCADCAEGIDSLVELLQGRFSDGVMEVLCRPNTGLFPEPAHIAMRCSCPDWAVMCKHVAAALYGVGARLDTAPELLFTLRQVDPTQLVSASDGGLAAATAGSAVPELAGADLGAIFGIELAAAEPPAEPPVEPPPRPEPSTAATTQRARARESGRRSNAVTEPWIGAAELRQRGVPNHVVQAWLNKGLVAHSGERGVYARTDALETLVLTYLATQQVKAAAKAKATAKARPKR